MFRPTARQNYPDNTGPKPKPGYALLMIAAKSGPADYYRGTKPDVSGRFFRFSKRIYLRL